MKFEDFICFEATVPQLQSTDRDGVITELVAALAQAGRLPAASEAEVAKAVIRRESEASTGMGRGVAVPHVKHAAVEEVLAAVGQTDAGVDFSALDEQPVYSVFLLVSPAGNPDRHLRAMEKIFKQLQKEKFRKFLRQCQSPEAFEDLFKEADDNPSW